MTSGNVRRLPETSGSVRAVRTLHLALALAVVSLGAGPASAADDLYSLFGVDMPPGDIVILIDASGSMGPDYAVVRQQVVEFVSSLSAPEHVCVYLFARETGQALAGPGDEMAGVADQRIPQETLPGEGTDIGLALHNGLQWLERDGASSTQALFLLTDGYHQPPADSPFGNDYRTDPDWQRLRDRGHELARGRELTVHGLGLSDRTDIELLRYVFPVENTAIVVRTAANTGGLLDDLREGLRRGRLQRAVERELNSYSVSATTVPTEGALPAVELHNDYPHLPVKISELRISGATVTGGDDSGGSVDQIEITSVKDAGGTVIAPGSSATINLRASLPQVEEAPKLTDHERRYTVSCTVQPVLTFGVGAGGLDIDSPWQPQVNSAAVTGTVVDSVPGLWSRYWWALVLFGLVVVLAWAVWTRLRPERHLVDGELRYARGGGDQQRSSRLDQFEKRTVTVGPPSESVDIPVAELSAADSEGFEITATGKWSIEAISTGGGPLRYKGSPVPRLELKNGTRFSVDDVTFEYINERLSREI